MRGKVSSVKSFGVTNRITPAYAGKSSFAFTSMKPSFWITPAYAGKSFFTTHRGTKFRDHPRLCGEKCTYEPFLSILPGSPPPMRGKGGGYSTIEAKMRITPAYAGKRLCKHILDQSNGDHPRLCGEKASAASSMLSPKGSPPPMRGKEYML